jgi:hypothetical protein
LARGPGVRRGHFLFGPAARHAPIARGPQDDPCAEGAIHARMQHPAMPRGKPRARFLAHHSRHHLLCCGAARL